VASHVAHDFRNALNAVAVNLEVVRGRAARGAEATAIAPFAATATAQFESASAAAEDLLSLARPESASPDVAAIAARVSRLVSSRNDGALRLDDRSGGRARTSVPADIARAVVARSVLSAVGQGDGITCEIGVGDGIFLLVTGVTYVPPSPDPELVAAASAHGVRFASREHTLELRFPVLDSRVTPHVPE
jgi:signal transduction histidine kinase